MDQSYWVKDDSKHEISAALQFKRRLLLQWHFSGTSGSIITSKFQFHDFPSVNNRSGWFWQELWSFHLKGAEHGPDNVAVKRKQPCD